MIWQRPHVVEIVCSDVKSTDFVTGPGNNVLLSERFASRFERNRYRDLSGFELVTVGGAIGCETTKLPVYRRAAVGIDARIDTRSSGLEYRTDENPKTAS